MLAEERRNRIIELLNQDIVVTVNNLCLELKATEATIRRDLDALQNKKLVRRIHGGATLPKLTSKPLNHEQLMVICKKEKNLIAKRAYDFIRENDAILLDSSTTVSELVKYILAGSVQNITVVTNSFNAISILAEKAGVKVIHTGGDVTYDMNYATGVVARNMLSGIRVDKCFIGANGIDSSFGYSVPTLDDADVKQSMIIAAKQSFVLADHTKFGECFMGRFATFAGQVDTLITDYIPSNIDKKAYRSSVNLIEASSGTSDDSLPIQ